MGLWGYTSKGFLVLTLITGVFVILEFIVMNQIAIAVLIFIGMLIPLSLTALDYRKKFREFRCNSCNHSFKISRLKLVFTTSFRGKDPPTLDVAYDLNCPKCNARDWLIPLETVFVENQ